MAVSEEFGGSSQAGTEVSGDEAAPGPRWPRRTVLILVAAAVVFVATVAAAVVSVVVRPAPPRPAYTTLPEPCTLVGSATLARFLPGATGTPESVSTGGTLEGGSCKWSSRSGGQDRTLTAEVYIFPSPSAIATTQQAYRNTVADLGCHCKGVTVVARPVAGLGDQATELLIAAGPDADFTSAPNASLPGTNLIVQSSNADIFLYFDVTAAATGVSLAPPGGASQLTGMISVARGILAALARPAGVSSQIAPVTPEPYYAGSRNACRLVAASTLARYAPGAEIDEISAPGGTQGSTQVTGCTWSPPSGGTVIVLTLTVFPGAASARQGFVTDAQTSNRNGTQLTVTGTRWLGGTGEQAAALFENRAGTSGVEILVWSGNAEIDYWYTGPGPSTPDRATLLAVGVAMARDGVAALARPALSSFPAAPRYAPAPDNACPLVSASTLNRYAAGATVFTSSGTDSNSPGTCYWSTSVANFNQNYFLTLNVTVDASPPDALEGFLIGVQTTRADAQGTTRSVQPVTGLGDQATAVYQVDKNGAPTVTLEIWSGNAEIEMAFTDQTPPLAPPLSRATLLAADIAMARDVLARLPRS